MNDLLHWLLTGLHRFLSDFVFFYPLFMSYLWMAGALYYWWRYERRPHPDPAAPPPLAEHPFVAVIVPCHNEGANIDETIGHLMNLAYPDYEVVAVDDGSDDDTGARLSALARVHPRLRVVHQARNQGKAVALNTAARLTKAEILVCIDGDAVLDPWALHWLVWHFQWPRVGAVTGNPRVRTRSTLLGRVQVGEFSSTIGMIKRAQRTYGRIFTVSGVVAAFRRSALQDAGWWSPDMLTEDVDVSWKLQMRHWDVRFEPKAMCWILMPETLRGLWRQRLRWAVGGTQVLAKNWTSLQMWRQRRMWPVYLESVMSMAWAYSMFSILALWAAGALFGGPVSDASPLLPQWTGVVIGSTCLLQIGLGLLLDSRYEPRLWRHFFWMIWYPLVYWMLSMATTVVGVPRALSRSREQRARWRSPDRGLRPDEAQVSAASSGSPDMEPGESAPPIKEAA